MKQLRQRTRRLWARIRRELEAAPAVAMRATEDGQ